MEIRHVLAPPAPLGSPCSPSDTVAPSVLVIGFDATVLNVALPDLARQSGADTGRRQWIVDACTVVFAAPWSSASPCPAAPQCSARSPAPPAR